MARKQKKIQKLVGRIGDEYYFVDYFFDDTLHGDPFMGATASILRPVTADEYEYRTEGDGLYEYLEEIWRMQVSEGNVTEGLEEWADMVYRIDGDDALFDLSYSEYWEDLRELGFDEDEYPIFEASGGGRSFSPDMKWDEIYDEDLWDDVVAMESGKSVI